MAKIAISESEFKKLLEKVEKATEEKSPEIDPNNKTRTDIAMWFTICFFISIAIVLIGAPIYNWMTQITPPSLDIATLLPLITSGIGTPLGFVIGYYFKDSNQ